MNQPKSLGYKIGDKTSSGREIAGIYGQGATCGVYWDDKGQVHFETVSENFTAIEAAANQQFDELSSRVSECLPATAHDRAKNALGLALYRGFIASDLAGVAASFTEVQRYIERAISLRARVCYTAAGTVVAALFGLGSWFLWPDADAAATSPVIAVFAGAAGAWTSVLQRVNQLHLPNTLDSSAMHIAQGISRILLGAVFGFVALAAINANLLLGIAAESPWAIGVVGYLAGFSERFVPEFLNKLEARIGEKQ